MLSPHVYLESGDCSAPPVWLWLGDEAEECDWLKGEALSKSLIHR